MRRILTAAATRIAARLMAAACQAATLVLLARQVIPSDFGLFGQAQSIGIIAAAVFGFGFSSRALVIAGDEQAKPVISAMYVIRLFSALTAFTLITVSFKSLEKDLPISILAAAAILFADMLSELPQGTLSGARKHKLAATLLLLHRIVPLLLIVAAMNFEIDPFQALVNASVVTSMVALLPLAAFWAKPWKSLHMLYGGKGYWFASVAAPVIQLDTTIVRVVGDLSSVGLYAAAARLGTPMGLVMSSLINILVPEMVRSDDRRRKHQIFLRLRRVAIVMALLIAVTSVPVARLVVTLLGDLYEPAFVIMCSVLAAAGISGINQVYQAYFFSIHRPDLAGIVILSGTLVGLAMLAICGSVWGLVGFAVGPVAVQFAILTFFVLLEMMIRRESRAK